jgi:NADPH:quinone reductase-like Zn-dependent oxidoreductase
MAMTGGEGVDVVVDTVVENELARIPALKVDGRAAATTGPSFGGHPASLRPADFRPRFDHGFARRHAAADPRCGTRALQPAIDSVFPLAGCPLLDRLGAPDRLGKILISITD